MSVLTHDAILAEIAAGTIGFEPPLSPDQVGVASVDLTLSNVFRVFIPQPEAVDVDAAADYLTVTKEVIRDEFILRPSESVLGITMEKVFLPGNICGWFEGRSRFARLGLLVHISAGIIQPGVANHQVLEMTNLSPNSMRLKAGERICQVVLERCEGEAKYAGKFKEQ